jgi:tetratricopeptide (TPR) repeat protein
MDPLTIGGTVIGILAAVAGIVAAVVQVREYLEKRRKKPDGPDLEVRPLTPPPAQVPHNLPPRREFVGRETEKARVHEALRSRSYLVSIDGIGGIGKTVLALEVAHECLRASRGDGPTDGIATFDGFIWTTAKDRDLTLNALLDAVARTLDYPGIAQQPVEEKRIAVQRLLQEKPHLLIVDNFETITDEGVRDFLLELPEPSKALITTREQKLRRVWAISLKGLTEPEALALIRSEGRRLGQASLECAEDRVLLHLYQATGGAPLAIKWAVGQIGQRGQSLNTVLAALHEARGDIFDNIFSRSWSLLPTDARQVLIVMPLFVTSASREGIEAASDVHHFALDEALGQLVEMSLVDATDDLDLAQRRYGIHPLTRAFATANLQGEPKIVAYERLLAYYIRLVTPPADKQVGDPYWDGLANYTRTGDLEPEWRNIEHLIRWALDSGRDSAALDLFLPMVHLLHVWGLWDERLRLSRELCQAANRLGHPVEAWLWIDAIGHILGKREQFSECIQALRTGSSLARQFDLEDAAILAEVVQARVEMRTRAEVDGIDYAQAKTERALERLGVDTVLEQGTPVRRVVAVRVFDVAASLSKARRDLARAREWYERELELRRLTGDYPVPILSALARVSLQLDEVASAEEYLHEASTNVSEKDRPWINYGWALVAEKRGEWQTSRDLGSRALEQFTRLGQKSGAQKCQRLLARLPSPVDCNERKGVSQINE